MGGEIDTILNERFIESVKLRKLEDKLQNWESEEDGKEQFKGRRKNWGKERKLKK